MTHRVYQNPNNTWQSLYGWFALYDCFLLFLFCCEMYSQATTRVSYCPNMAFVIVWIPDKTYAKILTAALLVNWRPPGRPRTTWMKTIQQDLKSNNLPEWSNWHGSESSTLETDVYVWHYAPPLVHSRNDVVWCL